MRGERRQGRNEACSDNGIAAMTDGIAALRMIDWRGGFLAFALLRVGRFCQRRRINTFLVHGVCMAMVAVSHRMRIGPNAGRTNQRKRKHG